MPANVLIVEDESAIVDFLRDNLRQDEHTRPGGRHRARRAARHCAATATTSSLVDVGLPDGSGPRRRARDPRRRGRRSRRRRDRADGAGRGAGPPPRLLSAAPTTTCRSRSRYPELLARVSALHERIRRVTRRDLIAVGPLEIDVLARARPRRGHADPAPGEGVRAARHAGPRPGARDPEGRAAGAHLGLPQQPHDAHARQPRIAAAAPDRGRAARHAVHRQPVGRRLRPRRLGVVMRRVLPNRLVAGGRGPVGDGLVGLRGIRRAARSTTSPTPRTRRRSADRADLALAVLRAGGRPTTPGRHGARRGRCARRASACPSAPTGPRPPIRAGAATSGAAARRSRSAPSATAAWSSSAMARSGAIERRERIGLATALFDVLVGAMGCALWAGASHARRLGQGRAASRVASRAAT